MYMLCKDFIGFYMICYRFYYPPTKNRIAFQNPPNICPDISPTTQKNPPPPQKPSPDLPKPYEPDMFYNKSEKNIAVP